MKPGHKPGHKDVNLHYGKKMNKKDLDFMHNSIYFSVFLHTWLAELVRGT